MQILQRGRKPEDRWFVTECYRCHTRFQFQQSEAKFTDDQREGAFVSIACPECGSTCHCSVKTAKDSPITT